MKKELEDFALELLALGRSARTAQTYVERVGAFIAHCGNLPIEKVERKHINLFMAYTLANCRRATAQGRSQSLKTFFKWCVKSGIIESSPAGHLQRIEYDVQETSDQRAMSENDYNKLFNLVMDNLDNDKPIIVRDVALWLFLEDCACRNGEGVSLSVNSCGLDNYDPEKKVYGCYVSGKSGRRPVVYTEVTAEALRRWIAIRPACDSDRLWIGMHSRHRGNPLGVEGVYDVFKRWAGRAGVEQNFGPQAMRHFNGKRYTSRFNLAMAQRKLGHKSPITTAMFYAHQDMKEVAAATAKIRDSKSK